VATTRVPVTAEMDDGRVLSAVIDQRDYARAEAQDLPDSALMTRVRFLTWSALNRAGRYAGSWEQFNTTDCVEASDVAPEEPAGAEEGLDPGRKAPPAAT
jgi:hypothetical protein